MTDYLMVGHHVKWEVFWIIKRNGRRALITKDFGNDLNSAILLWMKAKNAGKPFATLRCKNVAFPPPTKYQPYLEWEVKKKRVKGRVVKKRVQVEVTPMVIVNHRGIVWCPYCREFRKFGRQDAFRLDGILVPKPGYYCICGINSDNPMVRRYNPNPPMVAQRIRRSSGAKPRRARKSTRSR